MGQTAVQRLGWILRVSLTATGCLQFFAPKSSLADNSNFSAHNSAVRNMSKAGHAIAARLVIISFQFAKRANVTYVVRPKISAIRHPRLAFAKITFTDLLATCARMVHSICKLRMPRDARNAFVLEGQPDAPLRSCSPKT